MPNMILPGDQVNVVMGPVCPFKEGSPQAEARVSFHQAREVCKELDQQVHALEAQLSRLNRQVAAASRPARNHPSHARLQAAGLAAEQEARGVSKQLVELVRRQHDAYAHRRYTEDALLVSAFGSGAA